MRQGQVVVLRELFSFALGVIVMLGIVFVFNSTITPELQEYSLNEQAYSMLFHINSLFEQSLILTQELGDSSMIVNEELPDDLSGMSYRVYVTDGVLCIRTRGAASISRCINTTLGVSVNGNFLSGTELLINVSDDGLSFTNYIPEYEPILFYQPCGSDTVVNWDGHVSFLAGDRMTCGCDTFTSADKFSNPSFETGDFTSWNGHIDNPELQSVIVTDATASHGDYSVFMDSDDLDFEQLVEVFQGVYSLENNISFSVNSQVSYDSSVAYSSAIVSSGTNIIMYITHGQGFVAAGVNCNEVHPLNPNVYIYCLSDVPDNEWVDITIDPITDYQDIFGEDIYSNDLMFVFRIAGITTAYWDNARVLALPAGQYCDTGNDGSADGVCYEGECVNTYLFDFPETAEFFYNEAPLVSVDLRNFNASAACTLNVDSTDYPMIVSSDSAFVSLPEPLSLGDHEATVSCQSDNHFSTTGNITSGLLKFGWTNINVNPPNNPDFYSIITDFFDSHPGKELIYYDYNYSIYPTIRNVFFLSSTGEKITNLSTSDHNYPLLAGDVDYDEAQELIIYDNYVNDYLILYNNSLEFLWNTTQVGMPDKTLTIADINESFGQEILLGGIDDFDVFDKDGNKLFSWDDEPGYSFSGASINSPVIVADISLDNPGLELLKDNPGGPALFTTNGFELTNFSSGNNRCGYFNQGVIGELSSDPGLEVFTGNCTSSDYYSFFLLNSSFDQLWNYSYYWNNGELIPQKVAVGDVTGNGENELVIALLNESGPRSEVNDHYLFLDNNGTLINDYTGASYISMQPLLLELYPLNPGLEVLSQEISGLKVINWTGNTLYQFINESGDYSSGPVNLGADVDGDGLLEVIDLASGDDDQIILFETSVNASHNEWFVTNHDLNQTSYQPPILYLDDDQFSCESYGYSWIIDSLNPYSTDGSTELLVHFDNSYDDSSGNGLTITPTGTSFSTNHRLGTHSLEFDSGADQCTSTYNLDDRAEGTIEAWIYVTELGAGNHFIMTDDDAWPSIRLYLTSDGYLSGTHHIGGFTWYPTLRHYQPINLNRWHHVAYTWGSQGQELWLDHQLVDSIPENTQGLASDANGNICLGECDGQGGNDDAIIGLIDEWRVSSTQRSFSGMPPCCGDDGLLDDFDNTTHYCCNGVLNESPC